MKAYICVYRHPIPRPRDRRLTESAATSRPILRRFLDEYEKQNCFYDWGDDPSFFSASEMLGDVREATWGVCRPDVRKKLCVGDYVVFFCARDVKSASIPVWEYFYIGVGTVSRGLSRQTIWSDEHYAKYWNFFNILARLSNGELKPHETFYPYHDNWWERCKAPYWLFDPEQSQFNLVNPLHVATYTGIEKAAEIWHSLEDRRVSHLKALLFPPSAPHQHLRINNPFPHRYIDLLKQLDQGADLNALRSRLIELTTSSSTSLTVD